MCGRTRRASKSSIKSGRRCVGAATSKIVKRCPEHLALVDQANETRGLWAGRKRLVELPEVGNVYRLDYLEVRPSDRGGLLGAFLFALVANRAVELDASGLVLAALPVVESVYVRWGGRSGAIKGWNAPKELIPFFFDRDQITALARYADELEEE